MTVNYGELAAGITLLGLCGAGAYCELRFLVGVYSTYVNARLEELGCGCGMSPRDALFDRVRGLRVLEDLKRKPL
jgi:hypothetical protein